MTDITLHGHGVRGMRRETLHSFDGIGLLFLFTGKSGSIVRELAPEPPEPPPSPQKQLLSNWAIDWQRFFGIDGEGGPDFGFNFSRKLDPFIAPSLHKLPGLRDDPTEQEEREANLAFGNLRRGVQIGLPSGQAICRAMNIEPMTPEEVAAGSDGATAKKHGLHEATPLWYYVLKEAQHYHQG
ncbi:MAG: hypothetical protein ACK4QP_12725 [Pseudorhizobium sp.]